MIPFSILTAALCTLLIILDSIQQQYPLIKRNSIVYSLIISAAWGAALYFWITSLFTGTGGIVFGLILATLVTFYTYVRSNPSEDEEQEKTTNMIEPGRVGTVVVVNNDGSILGQLVGMEGMVLAYPKGDLLEGDVFVVDNVEDGKVIVKSKSNLK